MAIPGTRPQHAVIAKVRVGEKVKRGGKTYPASTDHFLSEDEDFHRIAGEKPNRLRIFLPFATAADCFPTGLEFWRGKQLTCYSKGEGDPPRAYRVADMVKDWDTVLGEKIGKDRVPVACPVRDCAFLKDKACKPMGRLQFWLDGADRTRGVYQIDTKSWNSVEKIEAFLATRSDWRDVPLFLVVQIEQRGTSKFPVIHLESDMDINTPADVDRADAMVALAGALDRGESLKEPFGVLLNIVVPDWQQKPALIEAFKTKGIEAASRSLLTQAQR